MVPWGKGTMPSRNCQVGDTVVVRATVIEHWGDVLQVRVEDRKMAITFWTPASEVARAEDAGSLPTPSWPPRVNGSATDLA